MKPLLIIPPAPQRWPAFQELLGHLPPSQINNLRRRIVNGVPGAQDAFAVIPVGSRFLAHVCICRRGDIGALAYGFTRPDERHRGHARRLMETLLGWFDMTGGRRLYLCTTAELDMGFYAKFGFVPLRRAVWAPFDRLTMIRPAKSAGQDPLAPDRNAPEPRPALRESDQTPPAMQQPPPDAPPAPPDLPQAPPGALHEHPPASASMEMQPAPADSAESASPHPTEPAPARAPEEPGHTFTIESHERRPHRNGDDRSQPAAGDVDRPIEVRELTRADWPAMVQLLQYRCGPDPRVPLEETAVTADIIALDMIDHSESGSCLLLGAFTAETEQGGKVRGAPAAGQALPGHPPANQPPASQGRLTAGSLISLATLCTDRSGKRTFAIVVPNRGAPPGLGQAILQNASQRGYEHVDFPMDALAVPDVPAIAIPTATSAVPPGAV